MSLTFSLRWSPYYLRHCGWKTKPQNLAPKNMAIEGEVANVLEFMFYVVVVKNAMPWILSNTRKHSNGKG